MTELATAAIVVGAAAVGALLALEVGPSPRSRVGLYALGLVGVGLLVAELVLVVELVFGP